MSLFHRPIVPDTRPLAAGRALDCAAIHARSFAYPWGANEIEHLVTEPNVVADAAQDAKSAKLYGFILSRLAVDEAEILTIAVDPALRRRGIAKCLLGAHLGRLQSTGVKALFLEVDEQNAAARALYHHFGFEMVGRRPGYYPARETTRTNALILRLAMQ
jgi:[ribosomal protein S18]-alanine N-acetyltransferase